MENSKNKILMSLISIEVAIGLFFSSHVYAAGDQFKVTVGKRYRWGQMNKEVGIQSKNKEAIVISEIKINRGSCPFDNWIYTERGTTAPLPINLNYGGIIYIYPNRCELLEIKIKTNNGTSVYETD